MDTKSKILFSVFVLAGILSATVLYVSVTPALATRCVREEISHYGELYNMSRVKGFGEWLADPPVPLSELPPKHEINDADVLVLGSSYMLDIYYGWSVGTIIEHESGLKTLSHHSYVAGRHIPLTEAIGSLGLKTGSPLKYVVFVDTERFTVGNVVHVTMLDELRKHGLRPNNPAGNNERGGGLNLIGDGLLDAFKDYLIDKDKLEYLVTENPYIHKALVLRNTFRFRVFAEMDKKVPVYSTDPPTLHYFMDVLANRMTLPESYYDDVADYLKLQSDLIEARFGAKLVVMVAPSKYTLCGYDYDRYNYNVSGESYDGFLPKLQNKLDERGVLYVDLYGMLTGRGEEIYEPHHSHWNYQGMEIAAKGFIKLIEDKKL